MVLLLIEHVVAVLDQMLMVLLKRSRTPDYRTAVMSTETGPRFLQQASTPFGAVRSIPQLQVPWPRWAEHCSAQSGHSDLVSPWLGLQGFEVKLLICKRFGQFWF